MYSVARTAALTTVTRFYMVTGQLERGLTRPRVHILNLHHVFSDEVDGFRRLLRALVDQHEYVGYSQALERIWEGKFDRPYLAFTFDDGLKSCLEAASVLEEFGVRGCFFVCPDGIGKVGAAAAGFTMRNVGMTHPAALMSWADIYELLKRGHEIGSHTVTHATLSEIGPARARFEIYESRQLLSTRVGNVRHFALPRGRWAHLNGALMQVVFDAGYESCATGERGCHTTPVPNKRALCVRREHAMANWPVSHLKWFLAHSALRSTARDNGWPQPCCSNRQ